MIEQQHFKLHEDFVLVVYSNGSRFDGYIMKFPPYQQGTHVRPGELLCNIPRSESVEEAKEWALEFISK